MHLEVVPSMSTEDLSKLSAALSHAEGFQTPLLVTTVPHSSVGKNLADGTRTTALQADAPYIRRAGNSIDTYHLLCTMAKRVL